MWTFQDKGERNVCLIPEVTGIIQELYNTEWKARPKPIRLFYVSRCYRYDRPQKGRYREFTQIGVECLGGKDDRQEVIDLLTGCLAQFKLNYRLVPAVKRGLAYYLEDGFEVECDQLGAQKQVAGGGRYKEGIGWAIGLDRLILAMEG
jgi:histidyl-tRNA synthetase